jgi:hypothetical protein
MSSIYIARRKMLPELTLGKYLIRRKDSGAIAIFNFQSFKL